MAPKAIPLFCGIATILVVLLASTSLAQDKDRTEELKQNVLKELGLDTLSLDESPADDLAVKDGSDKVILHALNGLVLLPKQDLVNQTPARKGEIDNQLEGAPENLVEALSGFLGQPLTLNLLADVNRTINRVYREDDRPVVDAYLPEQDVSSGVVQLVVTEGLLGEVRVEGAERSDPDYLIRQIKTEPGSSIRQSDLGWDLDWLNDHPFRKVKMIFEPGETDGTTDIVLQTTDAKPLRLHTGIDNTGLELTGENQWDFGITWGRVFNTEQIAAYQYTTDLEFESLEAHSLFYRIPLPWRHRIDLVGALVKSDAELFSGDDAIGVGGESSLAGLEYVIPIRSRLFDLSKSELSFGTDYKTTNSDLEFGGQNVFDETASVLQFSLGWKGARPDKLGATGLGLGLTWSPGNSIGNNDESSFEAQRTGASPDYLYTEMTLERLIKLPMSWNLTFSGTGQWSNSRLISTEQLLAGGYRTVRGFDENLIRGDAGFVGSLELIAPPVSVAQLLGQNFNDELTTAFFLDAAWLSSNDSIEGEVDQEISSLGLEMRYNWGSNWLMRAGYGWHLSSDGVDEDGSGRLHFGATLRY
tara:strand:- start:13661 stop:15418 length:1758 start_codon:yes stop_codon:yes gene_type:complete